MEAGLPANADIPSEVFIDACLKELSSAISKALAEPTPKCRRRSDQRPPIPARTQDEMCLKNQLRR